MKMKFSDIELAIEFVSSDMGAGEAYISLDTGEIHWFSEYSDLEPMPEGLLESGRFLEIPEKRDLGLGSSIVFDFIEEHAPQFRQEVREVFSRRGAYGRYKDFLVREGMHDKWHDYENSRETVAIENWCSENGIELAKMEESTGNSFPQIELERFNCCAPCAAPSRFTSLTLGSGCTERRYLIRLC